MQRVGISAVLCAFAVVNMIIRSNGPLNITRNGDELSMKKSFMAAYDFNEVCRFSVQVNQPELRLNGYLVNESAKWKLKKKFISVNPNLVLKIHS